MQADFVKNLDRQFQASRAEQRLANSVTSSQASRAGTSKLAGESPTSKQNDLLVQHLTLHVQSQCITNCRVM